MRTCVDNILICKISFSNVVLQDMLIKMVIDAYEVKKSMLTAEKDARAAGSDPDYGKLTPNVISKTRFQLFVAQQIDDELLDKLI